LFAARTITTTSPPVAVSPPAGLKSSTDDKGRVALQWSPVIELDALLGYLLEYRRVDSAPTAAEETTAFPQPVPSVVAGRYTGRIKPRGKTATLCLITASLQPNPKFY